MGCFGKVCCPKPWNRPQQSPKTILVKAIHEAWEQEFEDCVPAYIPAYLTSTVETHQISAVPVTKIHAHSTPGKHIAALWLSQTPNSKIQHIDCEVDTRAGCNILLLHKAQTLFGTK